jgi:hypothetical protein
VASDEEEEDPGTLIQGCSPVKSASYETENFDRKRALDDTLRGDGGGAIVRRAALPHHPAAGENREGDAGRPTLKPVSRLNWPSRRLNLSERVLAGTWAKRFARPREGDVEEGSESIQGKTKGESTSLFITHPRTLLSLCRQV